MDHKPHLIVNFPLPPQTLYQLRTTGRIWPRILTKLRISPRHLRRLHRTSQTVPSDTNGGHDAKEDEMESKDKEESTWNPQKLPRQNMTHAPAPNQQQPTWKPPITPPQEESQPSDPQASGPQPAAAFEPRILPPSQQIRPQERLYQRPPRDFRTHQPGEQIRRYRSPPRQPIHPYTAQGRSWIFEPPARRLSEPPPVAIEPVVENAGSRASLTLHQRVHLLEQDGDEDGDLQEGGEVLHADIMESIFSSYGARRARAVASRTIVNLRLEYGKDSHSWLCTACDTLVDGTQESHRMGCWVAWGANGVGRP
ncbi:hypothetical protein DOTSEDRAFT_24840 [Dothistroma septosporum NZE10]|uniref:Uncharacterized protein n=1 Tax=Dothistroma septosporum (strain NZE10 / CBS 128990) TaxID=675120 RepID=M2Y3C7_DOTSN|nr:hypothetical protein DOTSEDRAFT_24840 [Dothistroma septosporum NZE10]